ncbi:hypothetical protein BC940DRAFT_302286 [Gongronella butleri]|nr:hypothetical protein BC940DRAFT_302286 [Gongronella butleri]
MATDRPDYRDPKELRAVKVYTVAQESRHLIIHNIPALAGEDQILQDLVDRLATAGTVQAWHKQPSTAPYTNSALVTMENIQEARAVKRQWDDQPFYANLLQVYYSPEHDTVDDVRAKLLDRRVNVEQRIASLTRRKTRNKERLKRQQMDVDGNAALIGPAMPALKQQEASIPALASEQPEKHDQGQSQGPGPEPVAHKRRRRI